MLGFKTLITAAVLLGFKLAAATEIHHVIHDSRSDRYHVYRRDGSVYGRFDAETFRREVESQMVFARTGATCTPLTLQEAQALTGWPKIQAYAKATYGSGGWNIVVNPADLPGSPATVCVDSGVVQVSLKGAPTCIDNDSKISGVVTGTSGSVTLTHTQGTSNDATWSVDQSSALGESITFSAEIEIPEVAKAGVSSTTSATLTNSVGSSFTTSSNSMVSSTLMFNTKAGKQCTGTLTTSTCNVNGQGKVRLVADGFVWFNYNDKRAPVADPKGAQHFKYAVNIASVLTNKDDRSTWMDFVGSIKSTTNSNFKANC